MRRRFVTAAFVAVLTAALSVTGVSQAQAYAGPHHWMYTNDDNPGGRVDFWPDGDIVKVCDLQADGHRVTVQVSRWYPGDYHSDYRVEAVGNGDCTTVRASMGQPWNLLEGACMHFDIRLFDNGYLNFDSPDEAAWWNDNNDKGNC